MNSRRKSKTISVGNVIIGGNAHIAVQSMTKTDTSDWRSTVAQIRQLEEAGCEVIRLAVPDWPAVKSLSKIKKEIRIPLVADIHFLPELALASIDQGIDGLRINPGTIPRENNLLKIFQAAKSARIPIRIGINAGSLPKRTKKSLREDMVETALRALELAKSTKFHDLIFSLKASCTL